MQDDEIILEHDPILDNLDDTHESLIIQGAIDSIDGTESYAVRYLAGAMCGADMLSPAQVYGAESVWSTVKAGFNKSVTYIKNIFKGIWSFFFGKDADEKDEQENKAVEAAKSVIAKLPSGSEITDAARNAISAAATKASALAAAVKSKAQQGIQAAKILAEDKQLKEKLDAALDKLADITQRGAEAAKKQGRGIALAVSIKAAVWGMYYKEFRGVMTSQVKALAAKTLSEIDKLESQVKSAGENASETIKEKLASLKEVMKTYTSIQRLKSGFRSFVKGVMDKITPSFFQKA